MQPALVLSKQTQLTLEKSLRHRFLDNVQNNIAKRKTKDRVRLGGLRCDSVCGRELAYFSQQERFLIQGVFIPSPGTRV